ncbi:hypothetical protein BH09VER1_BH09VER1_29260 [soil metagenome]
MAPPPLDRIAKSVHVFLAIILGFSKLGLGQAPSFTLSDKGAAIETRIGTFLLEPPLFNTKDGHEESAAFALEEGGKARAKYPSGLELEYAVEDGKLKLHYGGEPANGKGFKFPMLVPMRFNQGGSWAFDAKPPQIFPPEKGEQFVAHGHATTLTLTDPSGEGFTLITPGGYHELQDNRVFNWPIFGYHYYFDTQGKKEGTFEFAVKDGPGGAADPTAKIQVDRFGQSSRMSFPGKVTCDAELSQDGKSQAAEPVTENKALDKYGGLAESAARYGWKSTGFFYVEKLKDREVLIDPEGNLFFQLGVCGIASTDDFTTVKGREDIYEWLPNKKDKDFRTAWRGERPEDGIFSFYIANWIRKYGHPFTLEEWTTQVVKRLRSWGFNSAGAFSAETKAMRELNFPRVSFLPLGGGDGVHVLPDKIGAAELLDPFAPGTEEALSAKFARQVAPQAGDPLLIGYFLGNEQHFEILPKLIPTYKASAVAAKARLVAMLKVKYGDIGKFNASWRPAKAYADFKALNEEPLFIKTDEGAADMRNFLRLYLETYYAMVERVFRQYDPNHLLIGSRWTPNTANNQDVVEIGSRHLDVISINYYTDAIEASYLNKVNQWSGGKPIIFSEWYYSTTGHGLGSGRQMEDEKGRGEAFRNYVEQAAAFPSVVGTQWFIYTDQALTGRFFEGFHGEGNNTGLVDVADRPYAELVMAAQTTNARIYDILLGKQKAFALEDPRFNGKRERQSGKTVQIPKALSGMKLDGTTSNWPGRPAEPIDASRAVHGLVDPNVSGSFRACWDETNLYFHIQVKDPTPLLNNKEGDKLWGADGVELFIGTKELAKGGSLTFQDRQILIGGSNERKIHVVDHPEEAKTWQMMAVKDVTGDGYVLQLAIPWKTLGVEPKSGMEMLFDVMIDNSNDGDVRAQQLAWNGSANNSGDRGGWGRAKLTDN